MTMEKGSRQTDAALVAHARRGDRDAFGLLVRRYQNLVCAMAYSRLGNVESAQDVAQEAFLVSLENLQRLRSGSKFGPWLRGITRRLCSRWRRSEEYRRALKDEYQRQAGRAEASSPEEILVEKENGAMLKRAIARLPLSLREVLVLHYFRGQSQRETARNLGISEAAVYKRAERAKRRIREYLTSELERRLRKVEPHEDFSNRTLAAIPLGSISAKVGVDVARIGLVEVLHAAVETVARHTSGILTGGGIALTAKQGTVTATVLFLAAMGTLFLVVRHQPNRRGEAALATAAPKPGAQLSEQVSSPEPAPEAAARPRSAPAPLEQLTVEQINELIANGSPELDKMDEDTRLDIIRHMLRDLMERTMSLELIRKQREFAEQLLNEADDASDRGEHAQAEAKFKKALAIALALYDVASRPENYSWAVKETRKAFISDIEGLHGSLAATMVMSATMVNRVLLRLGREDEITTWLAQVVSDINAIPEDAAWGADRAVLLDKKGRLEARIRGEHVSEEEHCEEMKAYLYDYLQENDVAPEDAWAARWLIAEQLLDQQRFHEAPELYKQCWQDAEAYGFDAPVARIGFERTRGQATLAGLPAEERSRINLSLSNIWRINSALSKYAGDHGQSYPGDLQEVVRGGYLEPQSLTDPFSGEPYQYTPGLSPKAKGHEVLLRTKGRDGMWVCRYAYENSPPILMVEE